MHALLRACAFLAITVGLTSPASAEVPAATTVDALCRKGLHTATASLVRDTLAELNRCHRLRISGDLTVGTDCNDTANAPSANRISRAQAKVRTRSSRSCTGLRRPAASAPAVLGYDACPAPCASVPIGNSYDGVANCLICLGDTESESMTAAVIGTPPAPAAREATQCHSRVAAALRQYVIKRMREQESCQKNRDSGKIPLSTDCKASDDRGRIARAEATLAASIARCDDATLAALGACGANVAALQGCALTATRALADDIFDAVYPPIPDPPFEVVSPADGEIVTSFSFPLEVVIPTVYVDISTLRVMINGQQVSVASLGGSSFGSTVSPGAPLLDANSIVVTVTDNAGAVLMTSSTFSYLPPKARVARVTSPAELIEGPLAQGQVGDYLLRNGLARFIVQDVAQRGLSNVGTYGGNLIDAELLADPGRDEFLEIQPLLNIESVINAQTLEIVNDGEDGTAAILRTCGPDDLLDFVNISSNIVEEVGLPLPASIDDRDFEIEACTEYILEPETTRVRMVTTVFNQQATEARLYVGDIMAAGGELDPWAVRPNGIGGIGEALVSTANGVGFIGQRAASGLSYSYVPVPLLGGPQVTTEVVGVGGITVALQGVSILQIFGGSPPPFRVPPGGSRSYARYFGVGAGGGGVAVDDIIAVNSLAHGQVGGCVTVGGVPAPGARVAVGPGNGSAVVGLSSHFVADADGCFLGDLRPGTYAAAASRPGTPFEMGSATPFARPIVVTADQMTSVGFDLPATARVIVRIVDENGAPMPGRASILGFDPSVEPGLPTSMVIGQVTTWLFDDFGNDRLPYGLAAFSYAGADGLAATDIEPGDYHVVVSRGTEYSIFEAPLSIAAGEERTIDAQIARVVDTLGFVSSDFHVHGINSSDSRVSRIDRALQYAGEGVDNIVMTEHGGRTDLNPTIADLALESFVHATIGEEITSWEYGHFNGYPFDLVAGHQSGGAVDWAQAAPPGRDFPSFGAFGATPAQLDAAALSGPGSRAATMVQINHVSSFYGPLQIDSSLVPPQSFASASVKRSFRLDPASGNLFHHFPAMELWNGSSEGAQNGFINSVMGIWFNLLNQGLFVSGTGVTDSHKFTDLGPAGARTWTASSTDDAAAIDPDEVATELKAGRAVLGQGVYLEARLVAADGSGAIADLGLNGSTLVASANGDVDLELRIQAPLWAAYDQIEIYTNSATFPTGQSGGINTAFSANPSMVLLVDDDFSVGVVDVYPAVAGGKRLETNLTVPFAGLPEDTWFVVVVRGTRPVSPPMFPVFPDDILASQNLTLAQLVQRTTSERGVRAMAISNPLFADVDGVPGFDAPLAP